ncbi:MAG: DM13 domain-containing protein [Solirubrobacterales bacterium]
MTDLEVLASGDLAGPEARGRVRVLSEDDGRAVEIAELWVAPGAPDVRVFASAHPDGTVDDTSTDLGIVPDDHGGVARWALPGSLSTEEVRSIVVYCKVYSVHFGHAELNWTAA